MGLERVVPDPTALLVIDEADRLKICHFASYLAQGFARYLANQRPKAA